MRIFSSPLPGEYIGSVIRRNKELLCLGKLSRSDYRISPPTEGRGNLPAFTHERGYPFADSAEETTLLPLVKSLGLIAGPQAKITPMETWRICRQCMKSSIEHIGVGYIRRNHMVPGVELCDHHGLALDNICPTCGILIKDHSNSHFEKCSKTYNIDFNQDKNRVVHMQFSQFSRELLRCRIENIRFAHVEYALGARLRELGYHSGQEINWECVCVDVNYLVGTLVHKNKRHFGISQLTGISLGSIIKIAFFAFRSADVYWHAITEAMELINGSMNETSDIKRQV